MKKETIDSLDFEAQEEDLETKSTLRKLYTVTFVCFAFMIVEIIGGYIANSIAIMSDAAHLFSDLLGFGISIISIHIAKSKANHQMSFGYHRAEVVGALASVTIIWGLTIWLLFEAAQRIIHPSDIQGGTMLLIAILGLIFNLVMGLILISEGIDHGMHKHDHDHHHGHDHGIAHNHDHVHDHKNNHHVNEKIDQDLQIGSKPRKSNCCTSSNNDLQVREENQMPLLERNSNDDSLSQNTANKKEDKGHSHTNLNLKAAIVHIIGDTLQNIGVIIAGILIYLNPEWVVVDSICTFVFAIIIFFTTTRILKECVSVIMEGSPIENVQKMEKRLLEIEGVVEVHDLHVWSISTGKISLTCHMISRTPQKSLKLASEMIKKKYSIDHITIQIEAENQEECKQTLH